MMKKFIYISQIFLTTQINVLICYLSKLPVVGKIFSENLYGMYRGKRWLALGGIVLGLLKNVISANIGLIVTLYLIPHFLFDNYCYAGTYIVLYLIINCILQPLSRCELFIPSEEDYCFLNHFMVDPNFYYKYKFIKILFENSLFEIPTLIWLIKAPTVIIMLVIIRTGILAFSVGLNLLYYVSKGKMLNKYMRMGVMLAVSIVVYTFASKGMFVNFSFASIYGWIATGISTILFLSTVKFLMNFKQYKMLAVKFANKRVVAMKVSFGNSGAEDETGITESGWEKNKMYFEKNHKLSVDAYLNKVFVKRFARPIARDITVTLIIYLLGMFILGILAHKEILKINSENVLLYSTVLVSLVTGLGFVGKFMRMWFRYIDFFMISNHACTREYVMRSMKGRYITAILWDMLIMIFSGLMIEVFVKTSGITINGCDFITLIFACGAYLVIWETYELAIYYFIQPYSADLTAKSPVFSILSTFESVFNLLLIFIRANLTNAVITMVFIAVAMAFMLAIFSKKAYLTFRIKY